MLGQLEEAYTLDEAEIDDRRTSPAYHTALVGATVDAAGATAEEDSGRVQISLYPPAGDEATMPTARFYDSNRPLVLYYARWMGFAALAPLRADVSPYEPLLIEDAHGQALPDAALGGNESPERRYFRLGSTGATSSLHYDEYHNCFAQVVGTKRWFLLPPSSWAAAWSFPKGHPRARQSPRTPVYEWTAAERAAAGVREVVTRRGDLLYIPPYHLHQTLTVERSLAVNIWSPSLESQEVATALSLVDSTALMDAMRAAEGDPRVGTARGGAPQPGGASASKDAALCAAMRIVHTISDRLTSGCSSEVLLPIYKAQYSHLQTRKSSVPRAVSPVPVPQYCAFTCAAPSEAEVAGAELTAGTMSGLPDGVWQLALADLIADLAEHVAASVPPVWSGERGRVSVVRCIMARASCSNSSASSLSAD